MNLTISIAALIISIISILLFSYVEYERRPVLEFVNHKDKKTREDPGCMWYHLKVRNKKPRKWLNRDAAMECIARISFLDKDYRKELVSQIEAHWTNQPEPRNFPEGTFDPTKIPICQRKNVGFREEMFDILIKWNGEKGFYAANPWVVYRYPKGHPEYEKLRVDMDECIIKVEIEAINLGKKQEAEYLLKNKGTKLDDIEIILLDC